MTKALQDIVMAKAFTALWLTVADRTRLQTAIDLRRPAVGILSGRHHSFSGHGYVV